jgi:altronate dehydratase small subunit
MFQALKLEPADNVATVVTEVAKGTTITVQAPAESFTLTTAEAIPYCHKVALAAIRRGDIVMKYGRPIGRATGDIAKGGLVGAHNIEGMRGRGDLEGGGN